MANEKKCPYLIQEDFHGLDLDMCLKGTGLVCDQCRSEIANRNWINPACRKPDNGEKVLCYTVGGFYEILTKIPDGWRCGLTDQEFFLEFVQSWQPLPKPPSGTSKMSSRSVSFGCSTCKHLTNCKDREKCGRENGNGDEPFNPVRNLERERFCLTKCAEIIKHYGVEPQKDIFVEECAELIKAVEKSRRMEDKPAYTEDMIEEMADVQIMIWQFRSLLNGFWDECFENAIMAKLRRQFDRIENEKEGT